MGDEKPRPVWAITTDRTRFVDAASVREQLERWHRDDRAFQPIASVIGTAAADEIFGDLVEAVLERAEVPSARFDDLAAVTKLECTPDEEGWIVKVECYGTGFEFEWDGTAEALRTAADFRVRDLAGQIKADRNRGYGGHHPWDD